VAANGVVPPREPIAAFEAFGIRAFTTTRAAGSYSTATAEPVGEVMDRWYALCDELAACAPRFATARQVHGSRVIAHMPTWEGWLRLYSADGHLAVERGTAMAVTVADCVPVFLAHPSGATALLHAGWRGVAAGILEEAIAAFTSRGVAAGELLVHLGPAICGGCYEVSPDVYQQVTRRAAVRPARLDLRAALDERARSLGVRAVSISPACTRCDNDRFFSHRSGDVGRQLGVLVAER
jgi:polyphenol oxidase